MVVETETATRIQLDLFYLSEPLDAPDVAKLWEIRRDDADRLALATTEPVTAGARSVCLKHDITLLQMDTDPQTKTNIWKPR